MVKKTLLWTKLLQTALKLPLFEKFLLPQCERMCAGPVLDTKQTHTIDLSKTRFESNIIPKNHIIFNLKQRYLSSIQFFPAT